MNVIQRLLIRNDVILLASIIINIAEFILEIYFLHIQYLTAIYTYVSIVVIK